MMLVMGRDQGLLHERLQLIGLDASIHHGLQSIAQKVHGVMVAIKLRVLLKEATSSRVHYVFFQGDHSAAAPEHEELIEALQQFLIVGLVVRRSFEGRC